MSIYKPVNWKERHKARGVENKALKRKLKAVTQGRENWKKKYSQMRKANASNKQALAQIKKKDIR